MARRSKATLEAFDSRPEFGSFVMERAGLIAKVGERQLWRVGDHELTVRLHLDHDRVLYVVLVLAGWPTHPAPRSLCLADLYAIAITGEFRSFNKPERHRFKLRALIESGLIDAPMLQFRPLDPAAPAAAAQTWNAIVDLTTTRHADGDTGPMPLVAPWLAKAYGLDEDTIRAGKTWLERHNFITRDGDTPGKFGKKTILWAVALSPPASSPAGLDRDGLMRARGRA